MSADRIDPSTVGPDKAFKSVIEQVESTCGHYKDRTDGVPGATLEPVGLPHAPDPKPFVIENNGNGG
jgi:hypothetical protein